VITATCVATNIAVVARTIAAVATNVATVAATTAATVAIDSYRRSRETVTLPGMNTEKKCSGVFVF